MVEIDTLELGPMENLVYLIKDCSTDTAAVVDPAWEVEAILQCAAERGVVISTILLTHGHQDHINGAAQLQRETGAEVHISRQEAQFFALEASGWSLFDAPMHLTLGESEILGVATPGHTPGSVCYYVDGNLFTGDTLFVYGCGRCDLEGSDPVAMFHSLHGLVDRFDPATRVYPGHSYSTALSSTLGEECLGNPFLQLTDVEEFVHYRMVLHDQIRSAPYGPVQLDQVGEPEP